jgi:hypothetical protein
VDAMVLLLVVKGASYPMIRSNATMMKIFVASRHKAPGLGSARSPPHDVQREICLAWAAMYVDE